MQRGCNYKWDTLVFYLNLVCVLISLSESSTDGNATRSHIPAEAEASAGGMEAGGHCGYFNVSSNSNFIIYDRADHNDDLEQVIHSDLRKRIQYINVNAGCEVIYCAPDLLNTTKQIRFCDRFTSFADVTAYKYLYADTASCSCKEPQPGCDDTKCEDIILDDGTCVQFYKESHCSLCHYDGPYVMRENETMHPTNNSFSADSFVVRENCVLEIDSEGIPPAKYGGGAYNSIQLAYAQNHQPAGFNCKCYDPVTGGSISPIGIGIISSVLLVLLVVGAAIGIKYYRVRTKLLQYSEDAIKRFTQGENAKPGEIILGGLHNGGFQTEDAEHARLRHYISMGYADAMRQPYMYQYEVPRDKLIIHENVKLGEGNFGHVCLGSLARDSEEIIRVAVKIAKGSTNIVYFVSLLDEIKILSFLGSHPNIVCIIGTCTENIQQRDALLLLEYCSEGNLKHFLTSNRNSFLDIVIRNGESPAEVGVEIDAGPGYQSWNVTMQLRVQSEQIRRDWFLYLLQWSRDIANGMEYLRSRNVVHVDLAARNVLLTEDLTAKVGDFGLSRRIQNIGQYARVGEDYGLPISWTALEALTSQRFTTESDVWSYGVTLWEIFSLGQEPYEDLQFGFIELRDYLIENKRLEKPAHATDAIYSEISKCWTVEPSERPTFHELKEYFAKLISETETEQVQISNETDS